MALYMVFDVESVGLHGEGFAVAWLLVDETGQELAAGYEACDWHGLPGTDEDRAWLQSNLPDLPITYDTPREVRGRFWRQWMAHKEQGAMLVADCAWPVETRFLAACVDDAPTERAQQGPYPLYDVTTMRLAAGLDPTGSEPRLPAELPPHHPLPDARQSARQWLEALRRVRG